MCMYVCIHIYIYIYIYICIHRPSPRPAAGNAGAPRTGVRRSLRAPGNMWILLTYGSSYSLLGAMGIWDSSGSYGNMKQ